MLKESTKLMIRKIIFLVLTLIAYFLSIIYLFWLHDLLWSIVCIFFTFISFHFLFLDIKELNIWKFILILLWLFVIGLILFFICKWEMNFFIILWLLWFNAAIWSLFYSLWMISFNSISYFMRWWYIFSLVITTMYSISLLGMFQQFPFTCEWLNDASDKLFEFIEKPFILIKSHWKDNETVEENTLVENYIIISQKSGLIESDRNTSWNDVIKPIISKITELKATTIDQVLDEQDSYSSNMCDMLLNEINSKFWLENFKRSVILLTYLLLYWFIRISFWVMSGIAFILFKIMYRCKVYRISETTKKVDEIY